MLIRGKAVLSLLLVMGSPVSASAGFVTVQSVSGPGGSSPFTSAAGTVASVDLAYTSVNYIDVTLNVTSGGAYELYEGGAAIAVVNGTGTPWTGFTFELLSGPPGAQFTNSDPDALAKFSMTALTPTLVTYSGGSLPTANQFAPAVDFSTSAAGTVTIRETPITGVPEPSSLGLFGIASVLTGLRYCLRRHGATA